MDWMLGAFFVMALFAAILSTLAGFGSALILISATSLMFDIKWSIALTSFFYFYNTSLKTYYLKPYINWPLVFKLSLLSIPGVFIGAYSLLFLDANWLVFILAAMSLLYLVIDLFRLMPNYKVSDNVLILTGFIYGLVSGAVGSGSLIKALVFKQLALKKETFVASMAASALPLNIIKISIFTWASLVAFEDMSYLIVLLLASYLGTHIGKYYLSKLKQKWFDHLVRLILLMLSISLIFKAISN